MTIIPMPGDMEADTVTITVDEYIDLQQRVKFLKYLFRFGVVEWEHYDLSLEHWRSGE